MRGAAEQLNVKSLTRSCTRQSYRSMNFSDILKRFYLRHDAEYVNMLSHSHFYFDVLNIVFAKKKTNMF